MKRFFQTGIIRLAAACLAILPVFGCVSGRSDSGEVLSIGVLLPAGGENAAAAQRMLKGAQTACAMLNNTGGSDGRPVKLDVVYFRNSAGAVKGFDELASRNVAAIIGGYSSSDVLPMKSEANRRKILLLLPLASADELVERTDFVARSCYNDAGQSMALAYYAFFRHGKRRMGVLVNLDDNAVYARNIAHNTAQSFHNYGGTVSARAGFRESDKDHREALKKLLEADIDVLLLPAYPKAAAKIIREAGELGYTGMIIAPDSVSEAEFIKNLPANADNIYFASPYSKEYSNENTALFRRMMRSAGVEDPGDGEAQGFDAVNLIAAAAALDGAIHKNIRKLSHHAGASGPVMMCRDGNADHMIFINRVKGGGEKARTEMVLSINTSQLKFNRTEKK